MLEIEGNIWEKWEEGYPIVIPTNTQVINGKLVMGDGLAKQCRERVLGIDGELGRLIAEGDPNRVVIELSTRIIALPTKYNWRNRRASLQLIRENLYALNILITHLFKYTNFVTAYKRCIYLPRLGCGLGRLDWETEVKPVLSSILDVRYTVVYLAKAVSSEW